LYQFNAAGQVALFQVFDGGLAFFERAAAD
jgi:hypothetical protein